MLYRRILAVCIFWTSAVTATLAQEGHVVIAKASSKELKRAAHQLRIPSDHLRKIRNLLQEATDLSLSLKPMPTGQMGTLGYYWVQFNRSKAASTLESLIESVRQAAQNATSIADYQQAGSAFQSLLQPLAQLDPAKAAQQARQWPDPPQDLGNDASVLRNQLKEQYQQSVIQQLIYQDPQKAAGMYADLGPPSPSNYNVTAQLALQLARSGEKNRALSLVDGVMSDYKSSNPDLNSFQQFTSFLQQVASLDPDRFMTGLNLLSDPSSSPVPGSLDSGMLTVGGQSLSLSQSEFNMLNMLRGITGRPELLLKALDAVPALRDKVDQIGGIDNFLSPMGNISFNTAGGMNTVMYFGPGYYSPDSQTSLFDKLKGKASTDTSFVRRKLSEAAKAPDGIDVLINLAQQASNDDPDLSSLALESAVPLLPQVEPLERRAATLQNLIGTYRNCEGEVPADMLKDGFVLADQLRQEYAEKHPEAEKHPAANTTADYLEQALISEVAIDHFEAAMTYLRAKPADEMKLAAYMRVIETLRQNSY
ncbi:MAG TPA: hypothetical protein VE398_07235 [Acidobacteriota bacterium]|nr:hypothetical protein [Acidobacteriota bacterium]